MLAIKSPDALFKSQLESDCVAAGQQHEKNSEGKKKQSIKCTANWLFQFGMFVQVALDRRQPVDAHKTCSVCQPAPCACMKFSPFLVEK